MGNAQVPQNFEDSPKQEIKGSEKSTQTDEDGQRSEPNETSHAPERDSNAANGDDRPGTGIPEHPPPYAPYDSLGDECSDDTSVKKDLSFEPKKKLPDEETLDDLKLTLEKRFIDCNERLDSIEKSITRNIEQQNEASNALLDLKDTVYTYFETSKEEENITPEKEDLMIWLKNEQFKSLMHNENIAEGRTEKHTHIKEVDESIICQPEESEVFIDKSNIVASYGNSVAIAYGSDNEKKNEDKTLDRRTNDRGTIEIDDNGENRTIFRIDSSAWELCIENSNLENEAKRLLTEGILPGKLLLNKLCDKLNRKSNVFRYICQCICRYIQQQSSLIVNVWAAFRYNNISDQCKNEFIFVVIKKKHEEIDIEYETYQRCVEEISEQCESENSKIQIEENNIEKCDLQMKGVTKCLKNNSIELMKWHTNLTRVTISWIKSSGFGGKKGILKQVPCIALYVQIKGLIPINEDPFEEYIDEYPVDVREGVFTLLGSPKDLHQNVRMGCALDSGFGSSQGTVGPFVRFESDSHVYLLTCAHVLLNPDQMKALIKDEKVHYRSCGNDAYQPPESATVAQGTRSHLGKIELALFKEGNKRMSGMEVVLVKINENRIPVDGKFPDSDSDQSDFGTDNPFEYPIERICDLSSITTFTDVYKFGAITGLQKGKVRVKGSSVRASTLIADKMGFNFVLHQQIEIEDVDDKTFAVKGDSGSLVLKRENGHLAAVGILEGKMGNHYMVTPICDIKQALSELLSTYRDPPSGEEMDIEEFCGMAIKLNYVPRHNPTIQHTGVSNDISAEIARQTTNLETQIVQSTDHKISSVKTELTVIKQHIDNTKNEIKSDIQEMENRVTENISGQIQRLFMDLKSQGHI